MGAVARQFDRHHADPAVSCIHNLSSVYVPTAVVIMIAAACGAREASKKRLAARFITATESLLLAVAVGG